MGRPREFDTDATLDKAMRLFWAKGYHDTSIRDLVDRTGVNYYGLYAAFENKHGLLLAALDRYRQTVTADFAGALRAAPPTREGLQAAFDHLFDLLQTEDGQVGCLMCNTAVELAPHDAEVAARVKSHIGWLTALFAEWLGQAGSQDAAQAARAEHLAATVYSSALLLRAGFDRDYLRRHVATAVGDTL